MLTCEFPSVTVQLNQSSTLNSYTGSLTVTFEQCCTTCGDPSYISGNLNLPSTPSPIEAYETASPNVISTSTLLHDHPSCDDQEVMFKSSVQSFQPYSGYAQGAKLSVVTELLNNIVSLFLGNLQSIDSFGMGTSLSTALNNTLRAIYHAVRLDLGVIRPNQIYNSSARFNASIANLTFPTSFNIASFVSSTFAYRAGIGNVDLSNATYSVHVPNILYYTPAFKMKLLPQAIAAVFVSTFSMLLASWHAFNFVTSCFVKSQARPEAGSEFGKGSTRTSLHRVLILHNHPPS